MNRSHCDNEPQEGGHTVVEAVVASALLVSVLIPVVGTLAVLTTSGRAADEVAALTVAQDVMERSLQQRAYDDRAWTTRDVRWLVRRTSTTDDRLVTLDVRVWPVRGVASEGSVNADSLLRTPEALRLTTTRPVP